MSVYYCHECAEYIDGDYTPAMEHDNQTVCESCYWTLTECDCGEWECDECRVRRFEGEDDSLEAIR